MVEVPGPDSPGPLSLTQVDSFRDPEERARDGKSGNIRYQLSYDRDGDEKVVEGKVIEIGQIPQSSHIDLQPLAEKGYTLYGLFRLKDRSTTTIVQNDDGETFKVFSFSRNDVKVAHSVAISVKSDG